MPTIIPMSFVAPLVLLVVAAFATLWSGPRPARLPRWSEGAALTALGLAVMGLIQMAVTGPASIGFFDGAMTLSLRLDALSGTMTVLVAFIGWIVMRYARTYLDGEAREGAFHGLMLTTLAAVLVLIQAASLLVLIAAFMTIGVVLRQLLLFYPERAEARRAAVKFSWVWHLGDGALIIASVLLIVIFGTSDMAVLASLVGDSKLPIIGHIAVGFLVVAALLKTASFPLHGWLTEVMEAPTPVSALLHAGIINAGGYLLIRTADLVQASPGAMAALIMLGGLGALFGAAVMLTQSAIKTALAWSTIAQMGFMLLQCGLGLWSLALLHIIAHSLYKAHAFLSSGGAVENVASIHRPGPVAVPNLAAVMKSFALALAIYSLVAAGFAQFGGPKSAQALALGAMLIFGVSYLVAQGLADTAPAALTKWAGLASVATALVYFSFQLTAEAIWGPHLPASPTPGPLEWALITLTVVSFGLVAFAQALFPLWSHHPTTVGLRVHLANGLYLNALLDRLIGGFRTAKSN